MVHLRYQPREAKKGGSGSEVGLVGKGVCYDSGGLAIKPREGMCGMKRDMGGAAAVFCGFLTVVALHSAGICGFKNGFTGIHAVLCIVENAVSGNAFRNDDVLKMFSGLTVEVNNTDAEGRLLLADGAAYLARRPERVDVVMEFATLTGAQGVATGVNHALLLSNSEELEQEMVTTSRQCGDLVHPMLFCPELHKLNFKSEIADMKNSVSNRSDAQSACAGWFVFENLIAAGFTGAWAHVDMCYPAFSGERGTGYGVSLITEFLLE
jgi:probable aminopeptidase NPEPL1